MEVLRHVYKELDPSEVIIVDDDSPDQTWKIAGDLRKTYPSLKVIRRIGRKGLSSAVTEGFAAATGECLVVMDSDLQHDPALLPKLAKAIEKGADIAIASRYVEGGDTKEWSRIRKFQSRMATHFAHFLVPPTVTDPMSGFFAIRRSRYESVASSLRPQGFKILLEILAAVPHNTQIAEIPFHFGLRKAGKSKMTPLVQAQFLWQVVRITLRKIQYVLFIAAVLAVLAACAWRLWNIYPLYTDDRARSNIRSGIESLADARGWPVSDIEIRTVFADRVRLIRRSHVRGPDSSDCMEAYFESDAVPPCKD